LVTFRLFNLPDSFGWLDDIGSSSGATFNVFRQQDEGERPRQNCRSPRFRWFSSVGPVETAQGLSSEHETIDGAPGRLCQDATVAFVRSKRVITRYR
jgi:hypothetical protein